MIRSLLEYSRVESRGAPLVTVDGEVLLGQALENLTLAVQENGAEVTHDPLPQIVGDPTQLVQVFQNLIGNAIKFGSEEPPRIHVSARRREGEWIFSVRDNGIGLDPEYSERIFIAFQRLGRREYPGTGIGLSICKAIVERHNGRIWVESELGKGATFYFTIPVEGGSR
jgi:light-regulated signal transduction histidine kinase (bacteriophytochrome)